MADPIDISAGVVEPTKVDITPGIVGIVPRGTMVSAAPPARYGAGGPAESAFESGLALPPGSLEWVRRMVRNAAPGYAFQQAMPRVGRTLGITPTETIQSPDLERHKQQLAAPEDLVPSSYPPEVKGIARFAGGLTSAPNVLVLPALAATAGLAAPAVPLIEPLIGGAFFSKGVVDLLEAWPHIRALKDTNPEAYREALGEFGAEAVTTAIMLVPALKEPIGDAISSPEFRRASEAGARQRFLEEQQGRTEEAARQQQRVQAVIRDRQQRSWATQIADPAAHLLQQRGFAMLGPGRTPEQVVAAIEQYYALLASSAQRILNARALGREVENGDTMLLNIRRAAAELKREGVDIHHIDKHPVFQRHGEHVTDTLQTIASYAAEQQVVRGKKGLSGMYGEVTGQRQPTIPERVPDEGAAPPNPSPEARARDAAVDEEHTRLLTQRAAYENQLRRLQAMTATKAFQRRAGRSQAVIMNRIDYLQRELKRTQEDADALGSTMRMSLFGLDVAARAAKRLYDLDIRPKLAQARVSFPAALDWGIHAIAPRAFANRSVLDSMMKLQSTREYERFSLAMMLKSVRDMFDSMPEHEQIAFIDRYKLGRRQPLTELQQIDDFMRSADERTYREMVDAQVDIIDDPRVRQLWYSLPEVQKREFLNNIGILKASPALANAPKPVQLLVDRILTWKANHYHEIWKIKPLDDGELLAGTPPRNLRTGYVYSRRPLRPRPHYHQSTLETVSDGIARGGEPVTYNPERMFELAQAIRWRDISAMRMWKDSKDLGFRRFVRAGQQPPAGWGKVNDRMMQVFRPATGQNTGGVYTGDWYMQPDYARLLNNYLSHDFIRANIVGRGIFAAKNQWTMYRLGLSPFHAITETALSLGKKLGTGGQQVSMGMRYGDLALMRAGLRDLGTFLDAPFEFSRTGTDIVRYISNKQEFLKTLRGQSFAARYPDFDHMLDLVFQGGAKLELHQDEKLKSIEGFKQALADDNYLGAVFRSPLAANQYMMKPLFEYYIPRLKLGAMARQLSIDLVDRADDIAAGYTTEAEVARRSWNHVEDLLGQVNWDKFFWHNTLKTSAQLLFRAAQWSAGYGRFVAGAFGGQAQAMLESLEYGYNQLHPNAPTPRFRVPPSTRVIPRLDPRMASFMGVATVWALSNMLANLLMTRHLPDTWMDYVAARTGRKDANGRDERVLSPGLMKDFVSLVFHGPKAYLKSKLSDPVGGLIDVLNQTDFQNNLVYNPDDPPWKQGEQIGKRVIGLPIGISTAQREFQMGGGKVTPQNLGWMALGTLGFTPAPPNLSYSKAENAAYELVKRKTGGRVPEDIEQLRGYTERRAAGQLTYQEKVDEAKRQRTPFLLRQFRHAVQFNASYDELKYVYDKATPEERRLLKPLMMQQYYRAKKRGRSPAYP